MGAERRGRLAWALYLAVSLVVSPGCTTLLVPAVPLGHSHPHADANGRVAEHRHGHVYPGREHWAHDRHYHRTQHTHEHAHGAEAHTHAHVHEGPDHGWLEEHRHAHRDPRTREDRAR